MFILITINLNKYIILNENKPYRERLPQRVIVINVISIFLIIMVIQHNIPSHNSRSVLTLNKIRRKYRMHCARPTPLENDNFEL